MTKISRALVGLFIASAILPLAAAVRAGDAPLAKAPCCFGTTCATIEGCTPQAGNPGPWQCKKTCVSQPGCDCQEGTGCCQFRVASCVYTPDPPCGQYNNLYTTVIDVSWSGTNHCYADGGGQVCCQTNNVQCAQ